MRVALAGLALLALLVTEPGLAKDFKISHQWTAEIDAREDSFRATVEASEVGGDLGRVVAERCHRLLGEDGFGNREPNVLETASVLLSCRGRPVTTLRQSVGHLVRRLAGIMLQSPEEDRVREHLL